MPPDKRARSAQEQLDAILRNTVDVVPLEDLRSRLESSVREGRPLRVKLGIDPSRPDLHLGHSVILNKLRLFQELGHTAVMIVGDFTGRVGDPTGESETRPFLTPEEIESNARTYLDQAGLVLDMKSAEVRRNSEWLEAMPMAEVLRLTSSFTVARMLERDDFQTRYREGRSISVVEFLYPLMQARDSVAVRADVEMGGTDQTFNLLVGRDIQKTFGQEPQVVFTMPLLEGTDGRRKMSKSLDNYVALTDPPEEMFGKLMSVPDELIGKYMRLCTRVPQEETKAVERGLREGTMAANEQKRRMAREVVAVYHGEEEALRAEERFDLIFKDRGIPQDVEEVPLPEWGSARRTQFWLPRLMVQLGLAGSNAEALRLIGQGAVRLDGRQVDPAETDFPAEALLGRVLQVGKRRFIRLSQPT